MLQGWIPRSGVQYGADLVLYEQHPAVVHSTICVLVVPVTQNNDQLDKSSCNAASIPDGHDGHLAWHGLEGLNRLCTRVSMWSCLTFTICLFPTPIKSAWQAQACCTCT